jgi:hypothetical protein
LPFHQQEGLTVAERGSAESTEGFSVERIARNDVIFREAKRADR